MRKMQTSWWIVVLATIHILSSESAIDASTDVPRFTAGLMYRLRARLLEWIGKDTDLAYAELSERQKNQLVVPRNVPFPCDVTGSRSPIRPTDVNRVRPGDVDVIGAVGDSLTTANGVMATSVFAVAREYRGLSWAVGGRGTWRTFLTLPNIIRKFNPKLIGFSTTSDDVRYNGAEWGATVRDLPYMVKVLTRNIRYSGSVDVNYDWKLITIMIGTNDFCFHFCHLGEDGFEENYLQLMRKHFTISMDYLRDNLPRTIVNVVLPPVLDGLRALKTRGLCYVTYTLECPCMFGPTRRLSAEKSLRMQQKWQDMQEEIARDERYRKDDFTVVVQPFFKNFSLPSIREYGEQLPDTSYLSEDCFHLSQKGTAAAANALWNNMLEPVGQKSTVWTPPFGRFLCPTPERPYISTYENGRE